MLANHWMNKETWIVYDPPSRVPIETRRKLGDPRFNKPYPQPDTAPKHKYPQVTHTVADNPRLNSWRKAVNRYRKAAGVQGVIKSVQLYESSADEPPDGMVDPASWVLRKPPQGIGLSRKQENAFYEGGAGWQETLSDWQRVRRGYRISKAIHEGRVNRTRAKQLVHAISRRRQRAEF
ncbi:hypothetical protein FE257_009423 [Aspergillus nanangensis]|uniref:Uncharacterized protein n=1 Tax=Aspergillus nanangensis TaxID=2582783 RepID=A0AAD4CJX0_ASPNN|nr:hypothetical protein FE257_009423 [Aspergillus nanangensis]